jgi:DNA repair photolyase
VGFTHSLNPYTGCRFACSYCYVQGLSLHRFHHPTLPWGDYAHPRAGIAEQLERELARHARRGALDRLAVLMSSVTDPYQPLERHWRLSRACVQTLLRYPPALLNVQTRSPLVQDDYPLLSELGERCWLNFTMETDLEEVRRAVTPRCPPLEARLDALRRARRMGLNVQITVSPCLPYSSVQRFGELLLDLGNRVIVDTFTTGDGQHGVRTANTTIPSIYAERGWGDWRAEHAARELYLWLRERIGDRAGWSQQGFAALPRLALGTQAQPTDRPDDLPQDTTIDCSTPGQDLI